MSSAPDAPGRERAQPPTRAESGLARLLADPRGPGFARGLVEQVLAPEDLRAAGRALERLSRDLPHALPWHLRAAVTLGGGFAPLLPWPIVPMVRAVLTRMLGHLVLGGAPRRLGRSLVRLRARGIRPMVQLLEAGSLAGGALGPAEADRALAATVELLERDDIDDVLIELPVLVAGIDLWDLDGTVESAVARLTPLLTTAADRRVIVDLDDAALLDVTVAVFTGLLEQAPLAPVRAGLSLPSAVPSAVPLLQRLTGWAQARVRAGGAGIVLRLRDENRPDAHSESVLQQQLDWALRAEHAAALTVMLASTNPRLLAWAQQLAHERAVPLELELPLGGPGELLAIAAGSLRVHAAIAVPAAPEALARHLSRRIDALAPGPAAPDAAPGALAQPGAPGDVDAAVAEDRRWGRRMRERAAHSTLGRGTVDAAAQQHPDALVAGDAAWRARPVADRARVIEDAAEVLAVFRSRLVEVQLSEAGLGITVADAEAGDAVQIAVRCAADAAELEALDHARPQPLPMTIVHGTQASLSVQASAVLAALAAGSAVLLEGRRVSAVLAEALWEAGVPRGALAFAAPGAAPAPPSGSRTVRPVAEREVIVVAPSADADEAIAAIAASESEAVLVGGIGSARRFRSRLADALGGDPGPRLAASLDEAITMADGASRAVLFSTDPAQLAHWADRAGPARLGVGTAVPARPAHPRSAVLEASGWQPLPAEPSEHIQLTGVADPAAALITAAQAGLDFGGFDRVRRAARSDEAAWLAEFSLRHELGPRAMLRYRPVPVTLRLNEQQPLEHLVRLLAAAARAGAAVAISSALPLPTRLVDSFAGPLPPLTVTALAIEPDAAWEARVRAGVTGRIRIIGADPAIPRSDDIRTGPVTAAGRIELLTFLREQTVVLSEAAATLAGRERGAAS